MTDKEFKERQRYSVARNDYRTNLILIWVRDNRKDVMEAADVAAYEKYPSTRSLCKTKIIIPDSMKKLK
jgi:hypothetical protein